MVSTEAQQATKPRSHDPVWQVFNIDFSIKSGRWTMDDQIWLQRRSHLYISPLNKDHGSWRREKSPTPQKKKNPFSFVHQIGNKDRLFFFILITEITWGWVLPRCDWLKYRLYMPEHSIHPDKLLLSWLLNLNSRPRYQTSLVNLIIISARGDAYEGIDTKTHKGIDTKTS